MNTVAWLMLGAALLPLVAAALAKWGGRGYDNNNPRAWMARQEGHRARANAAQANTFEALPFFFGAVLFALQAGAPHAYLVALMTAWLVARLAYLAAYVAGFGTPRSIIWAAGLALNIAILFAGQ